MNCRKLSFTISQSIENAVCKQNGIKFFGCTYDEGKLCLELYYDFKPEPLVLKATAEIGDFAEVIILPYRIELYINGALRDEEWPAGNCLINDNISGNFVYTLKEHSYALQKSNTVLGEFTKAEGWKPEDNVFVGDCMPYINNGRYHVLYLKDRHHHYSKWGMGAHQWSHISSGDMINWQIHPMAVEITQSYEGSICTGSWIKHGHKEYLFYTVRMADGSSAKISRSISEDGYIFEKDKNFCIFLSDKYQTELARDPKVFCDNLGKFHMLVTCRRATDNLGCLVHLVSDNLDEWQELSVPMLLCEGSDEPECPDYFKYGDYYYLIYSLKGTAHYKFSENPFENWITPKEDIVPCSSVPKAAIWENKLVFAGFVPENGYGGTMTFRTATADENGFLIFD